MDRERTDKYNHAVERPLTVYQRERKIHKTYFIGNKKVNRIESSETFSK